MRKPVALPCLCAATRWKRTGYLLGGPTLHAAVVLNRDDDDAASRARMLSLATEVEPAAAGRPAGELQ